MYSLVRPGSSSENVKNPLLISSVLGAKIVLVAVWGRTISGCGWTSLGGSYGANNLAVTEMGPVLDGGAHLTGVIGFERVITDFWITLSSSTFSTTILGGLNSLGKTVCGSGVVDISDFTQANWCAAYISCLHSTPLKWFDLLDFTDRVFGKNFWPKTFGLYAFGTLTLGEKKILQIRKMTLERWNLNSKGT